MVEDLRLDKPRTIPEQGISGAIRSAGRGIFRTFRGFLVTIGLTKKYTESQAVEAAVERLHSRLRVEPAIDFQIIWIKYRDPDPELSAKVVNRVAEEYQKQHLAININRAESSFYSEQIEKMQADLKELQEQLLRVKENTGIVSFPEQSRAVLRKLETLDNSRTNV